MSKTILLTGATDGIGLETAKILSTKGHVLLLHGRNPQKLTQLKSQLTNSNNRELIHTYQADLSNLSDVKSMAEAIKSNHDNLDVVINNAGVFKAPNTQTTIGLDIRFVVNTFAPYLLTQSLTTLFNDNTRVVNLSSAAQAPVNLYAMAGNSRLSDGEAYAQSKLAITMWTNHLALLHNDSNQVYVAVNPGSLLGSKMVKEAYGIAGGDIAIGADILYRAALSEQFSDASGKYFDNDSGKFANPHTDALDKNKCREIVEAIEALIR